MTDTNSLFAHTTIVHIPAIKLAIVIPDDDQGNSG